MEGGGGRGKTRLLKMETKEEKTRTHTHAHAHTHTHTHTHTRTRTCIPLPPCVLMASGKESMFQRLRLSPYTLFIAYVTVIPIIEQNDWIVFILYFFYFFPEGLMVSLVSFFIFLFYIFFYLYVYHGQSRNLDKIRKILRRPGSKYRQDWYLFERKENEPRIVSAAAYIFK